MKRKRRGKRSKERAGGGGRPGEREEGEKKSGTEGAVGTLVKNGCCRFWSQGFGREAFCRKSCNQPTGGDIDVMLSISKKC